MNWSDNRGTKISEFVPKEGRPTKCLTRSDLSWLIRKQGPSGIPWGSLPWALLPLTTILPPLSSHLGPAHPDPSCRAGQEESRWAWTSPTWTRQQWLSRLTCTAATCQPPAAHTPLHIALAHADHHTLPGYQPGQGKGGKAREVIINHLLSSKPS